MSVAFRCSDAIPAFPERRKVLLALHLRGAIAVTQSRWAGAESLGSSPLARAMDWLLAWFGANQPAIGEHSLALQPVRTLGHRHTRKCRRGAAVAEFAVVTPLLFFVLLSMIDVSRATMIGERTDGSARVGARAAAITAAADNEVSFRRRHSPITSWRDLGRRHDRQRKRGGWRRIDERNDGRLGSARSGSADGLEFPTARFIFPLERFRA